MKRILITGLLLQFIYAAPPSPAQQLEKVAVLNLKNTEGISQGESELLSDRLRNELFSTGIVEVMEREQMQAVLAEQGFQQSGATCSDEGCMVEVGKLLGVKRLISGSIGKLGRLYMINVKSINVGTGQIMKVVSEDVRGDIEDVVAVIPAIALKLTCCAPGVNREIAFQQVEAVKEPSQERELENTPSETGPLPCDGRIFIEQIRLSKSLVGFSISPDDEREIDEILADAFEEALDKKSITASADRLAQSSCKTPTIRIIPKAYATKGAIMKQFTGTLQLEVALYSSPGVTQPIITVAITKTGDRHWGDVQPLKNAFEAVGEAIEDDYYSKVKESLLKAGF